jgi:ferredoxin
VKVVVDTEACAGHARCFARAPDIYDLDDDGYCAITELEVPAGSEQAAAEGARACPEKAITVI